MKLSRIVAVGVALLAVGVLLILVLGRSGGPRSRPPLPAVEAELPPPAPSEVADFLAEYDPAYREHWTDAATARWLASVDITPENTAREVAAVQALADFTGDRRTIDRLQRLRRAEGLDALQFRQLEQAWILAAHAPGTAPATVRKLVAREAEAAAQLHGFAYVLERQGQEPRTLTPSQIDGILRDSRDLAQRRAVWELSKTVGIPLRDTLEELQALRNNLARRMDYSSYFALECADYGLSSREMLLLMDDLVEGIMPLYRQLHTWVKYELAARYGVAEVPALIPAHWLPDRWGQSWPGIVQGVDLDGMLRDTSPQWIVEQAERFYTGLGFPPLPLTFWGRSDLYELPPDANRRKNTHASAWHIDLDQDVRCLMNVTSSFRSFATAHHELGQVYYFLSYSRPSVPYLLRRGANRAFPEAIGSLAELAAAQVPYLEAIGLLEPGEVPDELRWLLDEALTGPVVFLPFACGTMTHWEYDLYENDLPRHQYNTRWWEYAARYQGVAPPAPRGEEFCDPATKTHVIDDPAQYYDYAISEVILHQLHRYICRQILEQDVHAADYHGSEPVGRYLESILAAGATRDGNRLLREATGEDLSANALLDYFAPLQAWLEEQNEGRPAGW